LFKFQSRFYQISNPHFQDKLSILNFGFKHEFFPKMFVDICTRTMFEQLLCHSF